MKRRSLASDREMIFSYSKRRLGRYSRSFAQRRWQLGRKFSDFFKRLSSVEAYLPTGGLAYQKPCQSL